MLTLYIPELKDYWYEKKLNEDPDTMSYNAGYDVSYQGYHYDTGTIDFPEENWQKTYDKRKNMFISPCDAKLTYYKINNNLKFKVKNSTYTLQSLINDNKMALKYKDGVLLVFRLSPDDYHRYIFTDDGIMQIGTACPNQFYTLDHSKAASQLHDTLKGLYLKE